MAHIFTCKSCFSEALGLNTPTHPWSFTVCPCKMMEMMEEDPTLWGLDKFSGASCHKFLGCGVSIIHDITYHFPSDIACRAPLLLTNGFLSTNGVRCSDTSADSSLTRAKHDAVRFLRRRVFGYSVFFIGRSVNATKKETVFFWRQLYIELWVQDWNPKSLKFWSKKYKRMLGHLKLWCFYCKGFDFEMSN